MPLFFLYPDGVDANDAHVAVGAATLDACVDDGATSPDNDATYASVNTSAAARKVRFTLTTMPTVASISRITVYIRASNASSAAVGTKKPYLYIAATEYAGAVHPADGPYLLFADTWTLNPNTGAAWTKANLDALVVGVETSVDTINVTRMTQLYVEVEAVSLPAKLGAARHRGSAEIHLRRSPLPTITGRLGLLALDRELLDHAAWQYYAGPTVKDAGWGVRPWERRLGALISSDFDLDALEVTVTDFDLRRFLVSFKDTMSADEVPSPQDQGVVRLDPGAGRVFARISGAWIENPAAALQGITQVVRVAAGAEKISILGGETGELLEPKRINRLFRSSMKDGLTGLTAVGTAAQSALDTTDLLFESVETPNSLKITRNATAEDQGRTWPATGAFAASDKVMWSIDYKNDSGVAVSAYLQRSSDAQYYRDSDGTWQAGIQYNALPVSGASTITRWLSKVIDVGAGTPTLTPSIVHRTADASGTISHAYHLQIELGRSATSRIITQAAAVTRDEDSLKIENFTGKLVYDPARLTGYVEVIPNFNSADLAAGQVLDIVQAFKDVNNYDWLYYDQFYGSFMFKRIVGGVSYFAVKVQALTRGTAYRLGFRATGADAEEDLAAFTISIFVDGVKGTDAVPGATWTPGASEYLYIGGAGVSGWDGLIRQLVIRPFVFSDDEMLDQP